MKSLTFSGYIAEINGELDKDSFSRSEDDVRHFLASMLKRKSILKLRIVKVVVSATELPS
jgi:hypothetical protein